MKTKDEREAEAIESERPRLPERAVQKSERRLLEARPREAPNRDDDPANIPCTD